MCFGNIRASKITRCSTLMAVLLLVVACVRCADPDANLLAGRLPVEEEGVTDVDRLTDGREAVPGPMTNTDGPPTAHDCRNLRKTTSCRPL